MRLPLYSDYVRQTVFMTTDEGSGLGFAVVLVSDLYPTCETIRHILTAKLECLLGEMFQSTDSWPTPELVRTFHVQNTRDPVSRLHQLPLRKF
jgi:hypothetical protein